MAASAAINAVPASPRATTIAVRHRAATFRHRYREDRMPKHRRQKSDCCIIDLAESTSSAALSKCSCPICLPRSGPDSAAAAAAALMTAFLMSPPLIW